MQNFGSSCSLHGRHHKFRLESASVERQAIKWTENISILYIKVQDLTSVELIFFFFCMYLFIYLLLCWLFIDVLSLSLVVVSKGYCPVAVHRLLIEVATLVAENGF